MRARRSFDSCQTGGLWPGQWSYSVLNHALQQTLRRTRTRDLLVGFTPADFGAVSDMLHVLTRSAPAFK